MAALEVGLEGSGDAGKKRRGSDSCTGEEAAVVGNDDDDDNDDDDGADRGADEAECADDEVRAADGDIFEDDFGRKNEGEEYATSMGMIVTASLDDDDDDNDDDDDDDDDDDGDGMCCFSVVACFGATLSDAWRPLSERCGDCGERASRCDGEAKRRGD